MSTPEWFRRDLPVAPGEDQAKTPDRPPDRQAPDDPYAAQSPDELYARSMGKPAAADPATGELRAIRTGGILAFLTMLLGFVILSRHPEGGWLMLEWICFLGGGLSLIAVFGFGIAATLRRQAWLAMVGGIFLTPFFYALWAWYRLASQKN